MTNATITSLSAESLGDTLRALGYRAEAAHLPSGAVIVRSATGGLGYEVHLANAVPGQPDQFLDATFVAGLQVRGEFSLDLVNRWNATKRFGRLLVSQSHLLLQMDVVAAGGIAPDHLRAQIEIWDRLVQELLVFLRSDAGRAPAAPAMAS